jgi:hypothetical protein
VLSFILVFIHHDATRKLPGASGQPMMGRFACKNGGHPNLPHFVTSVLPKMADTERDKETRTSLQKRCHNKQGVCQTVALPFTLKSILRQMKNYGHSNVSRCKNIIFKKII